MNKFYITTAIPYVNASPHIGHALEFVQADVIKRFHEAINDKTLLLSGGDENALKNVQAAEKENLPVQQFVDKNSSLFEELAKNLNVNFDVFQKGSSKQHHKSSQEFWKLCDKNDDIYKATYSGLYCVGCETFYESGELNENGECFEHPGKKLDKVEEENYYFRLSKYEDRIREIIKNDQIKIVPDYRKNEVLRFLEQGLKDISISRSNERAKNWGVPVPNDENQRMYVWFDALNIYRSGVEEKEENWWPADVHVIGKGIIKFHAIYWPAFLLSAGIELPKTLFVHGYFTVEGQKMSKSLGNVVNPNIIIDKYGVDALRYYLLREIPPSSDGDFSESRLKEIYNSELANELGNLVARISRLCESVDYTVKDNQKNLTHDAKDYWDALSRFEFSTAISIAKHSIEQCNAQINKDEPWKIKERNILSERLDYYVNEIIKTAKLLYPFIPTAAEKILYQFSEKVVSQAPLFPRVK